MGRMEKMRILECVLLNFDVSDIELNKHFNSSEIDKAKEILVILNENERKTKI